MEKGMNERKRKNENVSEFLTAWQSASSEDRWITGVENYYGGLSKKKGPDFRPWSGKPRLLEN